MKPTTSRVLFVTPYKPDVVGNGGNHRSYQLVHDLEQAVGQRNVYMIYYYDWFYDWYESLKQELPSPGPIPTDEATIPVESDFMEHEASPTTEVATPNPPRPPRSRWTKLRARIQLRTRLWRAWRKLRDRVQLRTKLSRNWKVTRANLRELVWVRLPQMLMRKDSQQRARGMAVLSILADPLEDNAFRAVYPTRYATNQFSRAEFTTYYRHMLKQIKPDVVVIDHSSMQSIIDHNAKHKIPTIICPQNLEALDLTGLQKPNIWHMHARLYDLASEYMMFERCDRRLFISKVEAGFVQGLGCASEFYPYRAVGEIRARMMAIRQQRQEHPQTNGLFLLIGSAHYPPIGDGLRWLAEQFAEHGLPEGVRVVAMGRKTDELLTPDRIPPGLELKGWTEQEEMDELLLSAQGILVPYRRGFGALTRLSELPVTGIPVIASEFATRGLESLTGIYPVANDWKAWFDAMHQLQQATLDVTLLPEDSEPAGKSALQSAVEDFLVNTTPASVGNQGNLQRIVQ